MNEIQSPGDSVTGGDSIFHQVIEKEKTGWQRLLLIFWALLGPGLLATLANNDAGGVISYAVTGAQFGVGLFVPLVICLVPLSFTIQEMSMRLSAVTQEGFSRLALRHYGRFWGYYHISTLAFENLLTLITEFIGMTAGLILLGVPLWLSTLVCLSLVVAFVLLTGYWTKERVALFIGALNVVFLVVAAMTHPSMAEIGHAFVAWNVPEASRDSMTWYVIATIGNAVAPWMVFFQGSGTVDKGVTSQDLRLSRIDTALGCIMQVIIAAGIIICGAALFGQVQDISNAGPAEFITSIDRIIGRWPAILFGIGLFNAGFLAAITVSLSSSWSIAELFGWSKSLNDKLAEAPKFYAIYIGSLVLAALAILIPNLPLNFIAVVTQVIGGILMTPLLIFMVLMTSNKELMGEYRTAFWGRVWSWAMVALLAGLTVATFWNTFSG
ncbi:natural resistance-associated macrophage protein [Lucifera butyrica]|uniref:Natural resistance-associated macrophage protein n=1 Tax=Lucifera butyrica TaxID=1351585 RepID=A0A498RFF6_9FIRM|nr:NRAMP family divalent metal transporter [Lucifera butyrica]VBB09745.1 natural resistance-associated macrophage protein [Lucifera butyrica]